MPDEDEILEGAGDQTPEAGEVDTQTVEAPEYNQEYFDKLGERVDKEQYSPTDEELDAYDKWEKGELAAGKSEEKPEEETEEIEKPAEDSDTTKEESEEDETTEDTETKDKGYSETEASSLMDTMNLVGAKSIDELPEKVKLLHKQMTSQGGQWGPKVKALEEQATTLTKTVENQDVFLQDLIAGKPEAIAYAKQQNPGWNGQIPGVHQSTEILGNPAPNSQLNMDEVVDERLATHVEARFSKYDQTIEELQGRNSQLDEANKRQESENYFVQEIGRTVNQFPASYNLQGSDVQKLMKAYWASPQDSAIDPRIQPVINLLSFADKNGLDNLEHAHKAMHFDTKPNDLIAAERRGRQSLTQHKSTKGLAGKRTPSGENQKYTPVSKSDVAEMVKGNKPMPESWFDADDQPIKKNIPKSAWPAMFGDEV